MNFTRTCQLKLNSMVEPLNEIIAIGAISINLLLMESLAFIMLQ